MATTWLTWDSKKTGPTCRVCRESITRGHRYGEDGGEAVHYCCAERARDAEVEEAPAPTPEPREAPASPPSVSEPAEHELADGEERRVPGSRGRSHAVKRVGHVYSCSCPAWRFQAGRSPAARSCKHLIALRGEEAEADRVRRADAGEAPEERPEPATSHEPEECRTEFDDDGREYEFDDEEEDDDE